ncbi:hypothetical protein KBD34_04400 [Patescibacteria group bacterium]|nr:hypothetical protein [Patescibacteria group bacterium]
MLTQQEIKTKLKPLLLELGLKEQEIDLYTHSLALGPVSIAVLAEHLLISPPNVYKLIASLEAHGLAQFSKRKRYARTFSVESPNVLRNKLDQKRRDIGEMAHQFSEALPDLLANYHQGDMPTKIRVLDNGAQVTEAFRRVYDDGEEVLLFGDMEHYVKAVGEKEYYQSAEERISRGIKLRALLFPGKMAQWMKDRPASEGRQVRFLKKIEPFVTSFQASTRTAFIMQPNAPMVLLIEDQFIVQMLRSIFLVFWQRTEVGE